MAAPVFNTGVLHTGIKRFDADRRQVSETLHQYDSDAHDEGFHASIILRCYFIPSGKGAWYIVPSQPNLLIQHNVIY